MDTLQGRVTALFPTARGPRTTRVGLEHELVTADVVTGAAASVELVRRAVAGSAVAAYVGFEPGGQLELSLPYADSAAVLARRTAPALAGLRADCTAAGVELRATPVDDRPEAQVPLQLTSPRYTAMQAHLDRIGPAGRRMMRRTASTQVCLDWWPGAAGLEQWQVLQLAGPFLAAAFAGSTGPGSRLDTWLAVDPARTAFDGRLLTGDDPVAAYTAFARGATAFVPEAEHLSTLFPPVRPRGSYLEVRYLDVQPDARIALVLDVLAALTYDEACRGTALRVLRRARPRLDEHWAAAAAGDLVTTEIGCELVALAARSTAATLDGAA